MTIKLKKIPLLACFKLLKKALFGTMAMVASTTVILGCSTHVWSEGDGKNMTASKRSSNMPSDELLHQMLGQKIMLDLRYYCALDEETVNAKASKTNADNAQSCREPMTELPDELANMIAEHDLGGVILFSENLKSIPQIVKLTDQLQQAGLRAEGKAPLFISIDQEGGRVARLPRDESTPFSGNMAIGATAANFGDKYATLIGDVLGKELAVTGFNVNHAPTVDVNINPDNPVINVRSFSEDPKLVAKLALAQTKAMQKHGVIATLKHFPGHGDTNVDSHTGLPKVDHSLEEIQRIDLAPFQHAIDHNAVSMIMTAHIQYPQLDDSTFVSKAGKTMTKPATMSRRILTDLLREKMGFEGLVITDALDMKGISDFFTETEAVIETFKAGTDIALMPIKIRNTSEIVKLSQLIERLKQAVYDGTLDHQEIAASFERIQKVKTSQLRPYKDGELGVKVDRALNVVGSDEHKMLEQQLADDSITVIKGDGVLPQNIKTLQVFMPDDAKCEATLNAFAELKPNFTVKCSAYYALTDEQIAQKVMTADAVVATNVTPKQSLVEMGGMDDMARLKKELGNLSHNKKQQDSKLVNLLDVANKHQKHVSFVSLRMPYEASRFGQTATNVIATYAYNQQKDVRSKNVGGPTYRALAKLLLGKIQPKGTLPVTVNLSNQ